MDSNAPDGGEDLPPPPPVIPPNVTPLKAEPVPPVKKVSKSNRVPMARPGTGRKGQMVPLLTNHFKVGFSKTDGFFSHYSVNVSYEDGRPVDGKGIGRRVIDRVHQTYNASELAGKDFAYDGEKSLFTVGVSPKIILISLLYRKTCLQTRSVPMVAQGAMRALVVRGIARDSGDHFNQRPSELKLDLLQRFPCKLLLMLCEAKNPRVPR
ncbi:hypothetical protein AAC387_Pa09g1960 [Persea americana]